MPPARPGALCCHTAAGARIRCVGDWAEKYPESVKALHDAGHEVMSHSNHHDHYNSLTAEEIVADVTASNQRIAASTGVTPTLIRCPYGEYDDHVISAIRSMGMEPIQWDVEALAAVGTARGASDMRFLPVTRARKQVQNPIVADTSPDSYFP